MSDFSGISFIDLEAKRAQLECQQDHARDLGLLAAVQALDKDLAAVCSEAEIAGHSSWAGNGACLSDAFP